MSSPESPHKDIFYASSQCMAYTGALVWDIERFLLFNTPGKSYSSPEFKAGETKWYDYTIYF